MARGWESKAIEAQQDEAARQRARRPARSTGEPAREERRVTLELTRSRLAAEFATATAPAHRAMLEQALAAIEEELSAVRGTGQ